jgi:hypothetical protein
MARNLSEVTAGYHMLLILIQRASMPQVQTEQSGNACLLYMLGYVYTVSKTYTKRRSKAVPNQVFRS